MNRAHVSIFILSVRFSPLCFSCLNFCFLFILSFVFVFFFDNSNNRQVRMIINFRLEWNSSLFRVYLFFFLVISNNCQVRIISFFFGLELDNFFLLFCFLSSSQLMIINFRLELNRFFSVFILFFFVNSHNCQIRMIINFILELYD